MEGSTAHMIAVRKLQDAKTLLEPLVYEFWLRHLTAEIAHEIGESLEPLPIIGSLLDDSNLEDSPSSLS